MTKESAPEELAKAVRKILAGGRYVSPTLAEKLAGRFPQTSGLRVIATLAAPPGSRVQSVEVGGAPLDPDKTYRIATNDFMLAGGDGYTMLAGAVKVTADTGGKLMANDVMAYCRQLGIVDVKVEGRMVVK